METQKTPNSQNSLEKTEQSWRKHTPCPQTTQTTKVMIIKRVRNWHRNRYTDQRNSVQSRINHCTHGQLICDKGDKNIQWRKDSLFNKWGWGNWTATCKRIKLEHSPTPYFKKKWIKDLKD